MNADRRCSTVANHAAISIAICLIASGCAAPTPAGPGSRTLDQARPTAPKRITAVTMGEPPTLSTKINTSGAGGVVPGADALEELVSAGLAHQDNRGSLIPQLAEAVPSVENGLWRLFPDGRMETTWTLQSGARWHDGTPLTSDDLAFSARVAQDRELPAFGHLGFSALDRVEVTSPTIVTVQWKQPYIQADTMFTAVFPPFALPMPRHILESPYQEDKASFLDHQYWTQGFVGAGPFRLREWVQGSHLMLVANEHYVLGRPRLDEVEVRFIVDSSTIGANVLAGTVELTLGRTLSLEQAMQVRDQWRGGRMEIAQRSWIVIYPQMINPTPAVVADARFRRALLHAIDRQQMAEVLQGGLAPVAHSYVPPTAADYGGVESRIVRYNHDVTRATQLLEELGHRRGPDGGLRDASGQRLSLELRTTADNDIHRPTILSVADYWQRLGVSVEPILIPVQRQRDREYRANSPAFEMLQQGNDLPSLATHHSRETPLPENNFVGRSKHRYQNPEFDRLIDRFYVTIPRAERVEILGALMHHITDQVIIMGLYYTIYPTMLTSRLQNVGAGGDRSTQAWNAHEWDAS